jgi:hypothetical protein
MARPSTCTDAIKSSDTRWTPPIANGAQTAAVTQMAAPVSAQSRGDPDLRRRSERGGLPTRGAVSLKDAFVDDEDVTGQNHDVL